MTRTPSHDTQIFDAPTLAQLVELRHDLHAHPQIAFKETYASQQVQQELDRLNIPYVAGLATTGVVGWIMPTDAQAAKQPCLALRADMDALPITEQTGLPYAAKKEHHGFMHACGHDGHTTILLGTARKLVEQRDQLPQPIKLIFQPAEESAGGARHMIRDGALTAETGDLPVQRMIGIHNWPTLPLGTFAIQGGPVLAGTDLYHIDIQGVGGHAAMPDQLCDPIVAASQLVTAIQTIVSRNVKPTDAAVLSVSMFHAGDAPNVMPSRVELRGTLRYFKQDVRDLIRKRLEALAMQLAAGFQCKAQVTFDDGYPPTVNDDALAQSMHDAASDLGLTSESDILPASVAEDFAYYAQNVPAAFILLGTADPQSKTQHTLHTSDYDFNDDLIPIAAGLFTRMALTPQTP